MSFSAIVCVDTHNGIGYKGELLCKIPEDMERFKKITMGHVVVMGGNTYRSIGEGGLSGRVNVVLSSHDRFVSTYNIKTDTTLINQPDINAIIDTYKNSDEEVFIIGGASIYEQFLPYCNKIYLTEISKSFENVDAYFPKIDMNEWTITNELEYGKYEELGYIFYIYERKNSVTEISKYEKTNTKADVDARADEGFDPVNKPSHYAGGKIEVIDFIEAMGYGHGFTMGNAIKYAARAGKKCPGDKEKEIQDIEKAIWYLNRRIKQIKEEGVS